MFLLKAQPCETNNSNSHPCFTSHTEQRLILRQKKPLLSAPAPQRQLLHVPVVEYGATEGRLIGTNQPLEFHFLFYLRRKQNKAGRVFRLPAPASLPMSDSGN